MWLTLHGTVLSPHTVRDHRKAIFAKVGASSQQELVATVYVRHYLPPIAGGATVEPNGWFASAIPCHPRRTVMPHAPGRA